MATKTRGGKHESLVADANKKEYGVTEASNVLGTILGRVEFGREEITITRGKNKKPIAKIVPLVGAA